MKKTLFVALFLVAGCPSKDNQDATGNQTTTSAPASKPATSAATTPASVPASEPASATTMSCAKLVTPEISKKYLGGVDVKGEPSPRGVRCTSLGNGGFQLVMYSCTGESDEVLKKTMEVGKRAMKGEDVAGVGRAAHKNQDMLQFWDDDTACYVTMNGFGDKTVDAAKDLVGTLTPETIK
jgi:hypothetical protein